MDEITTKNIEEIKNLLPEVESKIVNGEVIELSEDEATAIKNEWAENELARQLDEEANGYKRQRQVEYPPLEEQLDYIYHHGIEAWKTDIIQPIKEAHPKP